MTFARPIIWRRVRPVAWGGAALILGAAAGLLPVPASAGLVVALVLALAVLVEPSLGLVVMLCVAPLKVLVETEAPLALPGDVGQWAFGVAVGAWAVWRASRATNRPLPRTRVVAALLVILLGFTPSLFAAASVSAWLAEALKWVEMIVLILIVVDLGERGRWVWIAFGIVLSAALQAAIGLYEYWGGSGAPHLWIAGYTRFRAFGTFGQPNPFSAFMGLSLPLALAMAWGSARLARNRWQAGDHRAARWPAAAAGVYSGAGLLILGGLLASWGRGAWLGFAAALAVMAVFAPRRRAVGAGLLLGGAVLVGAVWAAGLVPASIAGRVTGTLDEFVGFRDVRGIFVTNENFSTVERLAHWQAALDMASAHPLAGVGLGNYEVVYPDYALPRWPHALGHAHNDYLNLLAETGIIGLAAYLTGWALIVVWTVRALSLRAPIMHGLVVGLLGAWTHLAVHSVVDKLTVNNLFLHIGVMLGLLAVADRTRRCAAEGTEYGIIGSH